MNMVDTVKMSLFLKELERVVRFSSGLMFTVLKFMSETKSYGWISTPKVSSILEYSPLSFILTIS